MKIHNIRYGFATNSSSSHSFVLLDEKVDDNTDESGFGWGFFTATSKETKSMYMAIQLFYNINRFIPVEPAAALVEKHTGVSLSLDDYGSTKEYIDHQSILDLPLTFDGKFVNIDFFQELNRFVLSDNVAIFAPFSIITSIAFSLSSCFTFTPRIASISSMVSKPNLRESSTVFFTQ